MIKEKTHNVQENEKALVVVRQFADAFRHIADFEGFVRSLEKALGATEFFEKAAISLFPRLKQEDGGLTEFPASTLCLPIAGEGRILGMARFSNGERPFCSDDLRLMGGLADLLAVMTDHALRFGEQRRNLALLSFLLNQVPTGVLCFDHEGRILLGNSAGRRLVGLEAGEHNDLRLPPNWREAAEKAGGQAFHHASDACLIQAIAKSSSSGAGEEVRALVLHDLTTEIERFHERFSTELYRSAWLKQKTTLVVLKSSSVQALTAVLPRCRELLPEEAIVGPAGLQSIGLGFPGCDFPQTLPQTRSLVRRLRPVLDDDWEIALVSSDGGLTPAEILAKASIGLQKVGACLRRSLLLHDDYSSVNDMLELILREKYALTKSSDLTFTLGQLRTGRFDGFFTEIELSNGASGWEVARAAREANPEVRPFFTSGAAMARMTEDRFAREIVFRKPFDVSELREGVAAAFA